jgi:hypothetical protein
MLTRYFLAGLVLTGAARAEARAAPPAPDAITFEQHVRPILKAYCLDCHGGREKAPGGLDLRLRRFVLAGGDTGPGFVANEPGKSLLIQRMKSGEMPPGEKRVPADQVAVGERWIAAGAPARGDEPATLPPGLGITAEERAFWFYQPLKRPAVPAVADPNARVRNPIDAFVLAKLREKNLDFNPDADRATLVRRATFDLIGLPPTPSEIEAFVKDTSPDAYESCSTGCSRARTTASAGAGIGSTPRATPTATATAPPTPCARTHGGTATTSFARSTLTSR